MFKPYSRNTEVYALLGPIWEGNIYHSGIDIFIPVGSPVFAAYDGTVVLVYEYAPNSFAIGIKHEVNGFVFSTGCGHVTNPVVSEGQYVSACQRIADVGDPAIDPYTTGPHIEFDIFLGNVGDKSKSLINEENWVHILNAMDFCD